MFGLMMGKHEGQPFMGACCVLWSLAKIGKGRIKPQVKEEKARGG